MTERQSILIVDDDTTVVRAVARVVSPKYRAVQVTSAEDGLAQLKDGHFAVAVVDVILPGMSGIGFLERAKVLAPNLEIVMMTGNGSVKTAVQAMQMGAYDYLQKPFESIEKLLSVIDRAAERFALRRRNSELELLVGKREEMSDIIGSSDAMRPVFELISTVADTPATVLVTGESGTGKELVARAIHGLSKRSTQPFVAVNCSAFPEALLDSELFGHAKGAFTGANMQRAGVFEAANKGTLFLDEVGDIALGTQARLLRTLQDGEIRRVGESSPFKVDTRVVAATNVDLPAAVGNGRMRLDFFYRLNVVSIHLPPLRERVSDIPALVNHFIQKHALRMGRTVSQVSDHVMTLLCQYQWKGNIRELENVIQGCVVMTRGDVIEVNVLPPELRAVAGPSALDPLLDRLPYAEAKRLAMEAFERRYLTRKLEEAGGSVTKAAELAGLDRSNFRRACRTFSVALDGDGGTDVKRRTRDVSDAKALSSMES